jgi:hypothetical protein
MSSALDRAFFYGDDRCLDLLVMWENISTAIVGSKDGKAKIEKPGFIFLENIRESSDKLHGPFPFLCLLDLPFIICGLSNRTIHLGCWRLWCFSEGQTIMTFIF